MHLKKSFYKFHFLVLSKLMQNLIIFLPEIIKNLFWWF